MKRFTLLVMFISLSVIGSLIKIPFTIGSIALDSAPAVVAAFLLGPTAAALVACIGHIVSALFGGFPLGPFHILVAIEMAALLYVVGLLMRRGWLISSYVCFFIGNALIAPLPFAWIMSPAFVLSIIPSLALATGVNLAIAVVVSKALQRVWGERHA
ncbi:ECF transporter S component [Anoxybacillus sp. D401a]|uniref:ECF transporter S component n=1 Tax=Anoxybacillus sp. D401a TaxID=575112 RepID=UPI003D34C98E